MSLLAPDETRAPDEEDVPLWRCEEGDCSNTAGWVGLFHCTCLVAYCEEHKEAYDRDVRAVASRNGGMVTTHCDHHGRLTTREHLVVHWSPF